MGIKEKIEERMQQIESTGNVTKSPELVEKQDRDVSQGMYEALMRNHKRKELFEKLQSYGTLDLLTEITGTIDPYTFDRGSNILGWSWDSITSVEKSPMVKILLSHHSTSTSGRGYTLDTVQIQYGEDQVLKIAGENIEFSGVIDHDLGSDEELHERIENAFAEALINPRLAVQESYHPIDPREDHWLNFDKIQPKVSE